MENGKVAKMLAFIQIKMYIFWVKTTLHKICV